MAIVVVALGVMHLGGGATPAQNWTLPRGMIDVTRPPYSCDFTGDTDVTKCLQTAVNDGYSSQSAVFFPPGRYAISDTLMVEQVPWSNTDGGVNIVPNRFRANTLIGSTVGLPVRPVIVLLPHSPGYGLSAVPKNVIKVTNTRAENINMNQVFRGINIEVGEGNPGAVGLYFHGAQGGATQDVAVDLTRSGFAGFGGGGGAGASHVNVAVTGGRYGLWFTKSEPGPLVAGAVLTNQTASAVYWSSQPALVIVGAHLVQSSAASGPLINVPNANSPISVVDAVLECHQGLTPIASAASIYLRDTYLSPDCSFTSTSQVTTTQSRDPALPPSTGLQWTWAAEVATGVDFANRGATAQMNVIYADGVRKVNATVHNTSRIGADQVPDPAVLVGRHTWNEATFPTLEVGSAGSGPTAVDATTVCGVRGDGTTDDHPALQACVQQHPAVFLPKGYYRLSQTLVLPSGVALLGLSQTLSVLMPMSGGMTGGGGSALPVVRVAAGRGTTLAFVGVCTWWHLANVYTLDWQGTAGLWRSNYETRVQECVWLGNYHKQDGPCRASVPLAMAKTQIRGTGRFYNFVNDEDILMTDHTHYRHVLVHDVAGVDADDRVRFYMLNMEHAMSEANAQIANSTAVDIFSLKVEGSNVILWLTDSSDVHLVGIGGGADAFPNTSYYPADFLPYPPSIVRIERSTRYKLANLANTGRGDEGRPITPIGQFPLTNAILQKYPWPAAEIPKIIASMWAPWPGYNVPPSLWRLLLEADQPSRALVWSEPNDKPILFQRGY
eukprot:m.75462 g.75462  ORF g.75462 m.75462 type:complete len:780 (+) comp10418_c0_seq1:29-2368(+)